MKDSGKIKIMKFSPDQRIASIQCEESSVDFICLSSTADDLVTTQFSQSTKMRSARIVGLEWLTNNQLLFVTNQGLELYQVNVEKKNTKLLKTYNISLYWFIYYNGSLHRLTKFEVDFGSSNAKTNLIEREVTVASM
ncbi:unnamed protein product [Anisakis simplex]|uniref:ANAPC4_WD40 domain-containing protein n=1 Tax=Anisakis simplex TaxID=6269 RepID=A0A0M3J878_ANISI|nr:unnamed protein product [Anisakis simplex]VDK21981.1 unnamed protein product [Anisakis simplex]